MGKNDIYSKILSIDCTKILLESSFFTSFDLSYLNFLSSKEVWGSLKTSTPTEMQNMFEGKLLHRYDILRLENGIDLPFSERLN